MHKMKIKVFQYNLYNMKHMYHNMASKYVKRGHRCHNSIGKDTIPLEDKGVFLVSR